MTRRMRFHWSIPTFGHLAQPRGSVPHGGNVGRVDLVRHEAFVQEADELGIDSLLLPVGFHRPDPLTFAAAFAGRTRRVEFMVAFRSGLVSPTYFVQQINTISALSGGRVSINMVAGTTAAEQRYYGDRLPHDERFHRTSEFLDVCRQLWTVDTPVDHDGTYYTVRGARVNTPFVSPTRTAPRIFLGGSSQQAAQVAARHAGCHLRFMDLQPDQLAASTTPMVELGVAVGLVLHVVIGETREQAQELATAMVHRAGERARGFHQDFQSRSDSVGLRTVYEMAGRGSQWLTPVLWTGAVPFLGPAGVMLVGTPRDVADELMSLHRAGISDVVLHGDDMMTTFGQQVLPLVRALEE